VLLISNRSSFPEKFFLAQDVLSYKSARTDYLTSCLCPRRQLASERRLPLRQPPAELSYSAPLPKREPSQKWLGSPAFQRLAIQRKQDLRFAYFIS